MKNNPAQEKKAHKTKHSRKVALEQQIYNEK